MSDSRQNPFSPSGVTSAKPQPPSSGGLDFAKLFTFLFDSPKWFVNWLCCTVTLLIPIVGAMVIWGYQAEATERLIRNPSEPYPDFDFSRFGDYLMRGLWPFLIALTVGLVSIPVYLIAVFVFGMGSVISESMAIFSTLLMMVVYMVYGAIIAAISQPMVLRSAMTKDFMQGFNLDFIKQYLSRIWKELLMGMLVIIVVTPFLAIAGFLALCIGYLFALSLVTLAYGHLQYQLYRLYLERGGEPIPYVN